MRISKTEYLIFAAVWILAAMVRMYGTVWGPSVRPPMNTSAFLAGKPSSYAQACFTLEAYGWTLTVKGTGLDAAIAFVDVLDFELAGVEFKLRTRKRLKPSSEGRLLVPRLFQPTQVLVLLCVQVAGSLQGFQGSKVVQVD